MDRELVKAVLEGAVFIIVFAVCLLGVPIMVSILLCKSLGIPLADPRAVAIAIAVTVLWFFAYALYSKIEIESVIERCAACCGRSYSEVEKCMKFEDEDGVE